MAELSGMPGYLVIIFLLFAVFSSAWALVTLQSFKKKIAKTEREISILQEQEEEASENLNRRIAGLKKLTDDTVNQLLVKFNEVLEKVNASLKEIKKSTLEETSHLIASTQASIETSMKTQQTERGFRKRLKRRDTLKTMMSISRRRTARVFRYCSQLIQGMIVKER